MKRLVPVLVILIALFSAACKRIDNSNPDDMLLTAAQLGDIDRVRLAIAKGANLNYQDEHGGTALHWAVFYGYKDIVQLLLMQGANPLIKDKDGITPIDVARINNKKEMLKLLEKYVKKKKE